MTDDEARQRIDSMTLREREELVIQCERAWQTRLGSGARSRCARCSMKPSGRCTDGNSSF